MLTVTYFYVRVLARSLEGAMFHIVDDEKDICNFLSEFIQDLGYEAKAFSCPVDYLQYVNSLDFTLPTAILSDVRMPKMNGFEMIKAIREQYPLIRTAIISGYSENKQKAKDESCIYLEKPVHMEKLEEMVESFVLCMESGPDPKTYECNASKKEDEAGDWLCPHSSRCNSC